MIRCPDRPYCHTAMVFVVAPKSILALTRPTEFLCPRLFGVSVAAAPSSPTSLPIKITTP